MCDGSTHDWLAGGRGLSGRARPLHGSWRCMEGVVNGLALHGNWKITAASTGGFEWGLSSST